MDTTILHIKARDLYAAIELDRDRSRGTGPLAIFDTAEPETIVGVAGVDDGVVCEGMLLAEARKALPDAEYISAEYDVYHRHSEMLTDTLRELVPMLEQFNFDEWFCDTTGVDKVELTETIKKQLSRRIPFDISIRHSDNKFLAKLSNDLNVPITSENARDVLGSTSLESFWGVPDKVIAALRTLGLEKIGEVGGLDEKLLETVLPGHSGRLCELGKGVDSFPLRPFAKPIRLSLTDRLILTAEKDYQKKFIHSIAGRLADKLEASGHNAFLLGVQIVGEGQQIRNQVRLTVQSNKVTHFTGALKLMLDSMKDMLPDSGSMNVTVEALEIMCDKNVYQFHGEPHEDFEIIR